MAVIVRVLVVDVPVQEHLGHSNERQNLHFRLVMSQFMEANTEPQCRPKGPARQEGHGDSPTVWRNHRAIVEESSSQVKGGDFARRPECILVVSNLGWCRFQAVTPAPECLTRG